MSIQKWYATRNKKKSSCTLCSYFGVFNVLLLFSIFICIIQFVIMISIFFFSLFFGVHLYIIFVWAWHPLLSSTYAWFGRQLNEKPFITNAKIQSIKLSHTHTKYNTKFTQYAAERVGDNEQKEKEIRANRIKIKIKNKPE